jgi:hypothetical protein
MAAVASVGSRGRLRPQRQPQPLWPRPTCSRPVVQAHRRWLGDCGEWRRDLRDAGAVAVAGDGGGAAAVAGGGAGWPAA